MIIETVAFIIGVIVIFAAGIYLVHPSDRRINYMDDERNKRERDYYKWL